MLYACSVQRKWSKIANRMILLQLISNDCGAQRMQCPQNNAGTVFASFTGTPHILCAEGQCHPCSIAQFHVNCETSIVCPGTKVFPWRSSTWGSWAHLSERERAPSLTPSNWALPHRGCRLSPLVEDSRDLLKAGPRKSKRIINHNLVKQKLGFWIASQDFHYWWSVAASWCCWWLETVDSPPANSWVGWKHLLWRRHVSGFTALDAFRRFTVSTNICLSYSQRNQRFRVNPGFICFIALS